MNIIDKLYLWKMSCLGLKYEKDKPEIKFEKKKIEDLKAKKLSLEKSYQIILEEFYRGDFSNKQMFISILEYMENHNAYICSIYPNKIYDELLI